MDMSLSAVDRRGLSRRSGPGGVEIGRILRQVPLLIGLDDSTIEVLCNGASFQSFRRGTTIFRRGSVPTGLYFVVDGAVKLLALAANGKEKTIELFEPGRMFGEIGVFRLAEYRSWTQAVTMTLLIHVPAQNVLEAVRADHGLALRMLGAVSGRVQDLIESIGQSAPLDARSRVCGFLFERLQTLESSNRVALLAPKSTIASILNLTSEAFSRVLRSLREEGIIQVAGRQILILDPGRLSKGIGG